MKAQEDASTAQATRVGDGSTSDFQQIASAEFAAWLGARRRAAGAPVRTVFVADERVDRAPLAMLLSGPESGGGGRGGQLRVKVYLSLLWICARRPYDVARPARAWAALLGLPDHERNGVRRVQQAFHDLAERDFIELEEQGGRPSRAILRSEKGDGTAFVPAPDAHNKLLKAGAPDLVLNDHRYFRIPSTLWTQGHIARLNGPGLAMLLVLLSERRGSASTDVWFSPDRAKQRFGLAASTRRDGLQQLRDLGLVVTKSKIVSENGAYIDWARRRNVHEVRGL